MGGTGFIYIPIETVILSCVAFGMMLGGIIGYAVGRTER